MKTHLAFNNIVGYMNFETSYRDGKFFFQTFITCWHLMTVDATELMESVM